VHAIYPEVKGRTTTDITFISNADSTKQRYVEILPDAFKKNVSHDVLIALHGHGSDRWQFAKDNRDECRAARDAAKKYRMIYISPDYRARTSWMGPKAEADVVQIIKELKKKHRVSRVFLCGASMGGTSSLAFAVLHPKLIDGVASMNGTANMLEFDNFQSAIGKSYGGTKKQVPLEYKNRSAEYWPEKLTMPIGLAVSGKDKDVPPHSVLRLTRVLQAMGHCPVKLIHRPQMGHSTKYDDALAILDFVIKSAKIR
jgi:pimeloyl-ACP methyl ester carboxylesterase